MEEENGNFERAVKHKIIAASLGNEDSMKALWKCCFSKGYISKDDLTVNRDPACTSGCSECDKMSTEGESRRIKEKG